MFKVQNLTVLRSCCLTVFKTNWKENLYLLSLAAFLVALPTSVSFISIAAVALLIVWIFTGDYKEKWHRLIHNKSALLLISIPLVYLIGLCFTQNFSIGLHELNKSSYWFIFAFVLASSKPISYKATFRLLGIYILTVTVAASFALFKLLFADSIFYSDFREVTWIHHIPFSFHIAFAIWLIIYFIIKEIFSGIQKSLLFLLIIFLLVALFSLKSFSAYLYFGVMSFTALLILILRTKKEILKYAYLIGITLLLVFPVFYVYHCVQKFYNITEYSEEKIEKYTSNGNLYKHNFENKSKENGNYTYLFICEKELIPLWNKNSSKQYNSKTSNNYPLYSVIIRYMTSKGLRKDADGFSQLSQKDIENIENEIPNYIYARNKLSIYPRIYETIWEIDQYKISKNPNKKSLIQRLELALLAGNIIKTEPLLGIGLGNNASAFEQAIERTGSKLIFPEIDSSHNQYLNYLIRFGILGTLYILGVLLWVFFIERKNNPFLITIFFVSILVANLAEINWETFLGLNFFAFFFCFLMWSTPKDIKNQV
jgi:hypothetical protein